MNEHPDSSKESPPSANTSPPIQIPEPISTPLRQAATEEHLAKMEGEMNAFERSTLKWTRATFGVYLLTALFIAFQWNAMRSQTSILAAQSETMQRQLEATDRPWIKLTNMKALEITFTDAHLTNKGTRTQAWFQVNPEITNIGHSIATQTRIELWLVLHPWANAWGNFKAELETVCRNAVSHKDGLTLFPDDPYSGTNYGLPGQLTADHTSRDRAGALSIVPALVGCIDYQFPASIRHHQTRFAFEVVHSEDGARFFRIGQNVPGNGIRLIRNAYYDYAD